MIRAAAVPVPGGKDHRDARVFAGLGRGPCSCSALDLVVPGQQQSQQQRAWFGVRQHVLADESCRLVIGWGAKKGGEVQQARGFRKPYTLHPKWGGGGGGGGTAHW